MTESLNMWVTGPNYLSLKVERREKTIRKNDPFLRPSHPLKNQL